MEVIISHTSADFDSLASMVAASKLYPRAKMYFTGTPDQSVSDFMALHKDLFPVEYPKHIKKLSLSKLIIVDTQLPGRLGEFREFVSNPQIQVHIFDHHPPAQEGIVGDFSLIESVGATITLLVRKIREKKLPITPLEATLYALGIYEETGSFTFATTTSEDVETISFLLSCGANLKVISNFIHHSLNENQHKLLNEFILNSKLYNCSGYQVLVVKAITDKYVRESAIVVHRLMDLEACDVIFALINMKDRIYIIARSKQKDIDLNNILSHFGGGGHSTAASAAIKGDNISKIEAELIETFKRSIPSSSLTAKDIMSKPVRYIDLAHDKTIADAQRLILQFGHSGLVVYRDKKLAGVISRRDIDKAINHGFKNSPVSAYMSKNVITATDSTPVVELQRLMIRHQIGRIPIVEKDKVIGIVTRTDILKTLHGHQISHTSFNRIKPDENLKLLPVHIQKILKICGKVADELNLPVYLVGGFVRDLLLRVEDLDMDIVVEGDGILYAEKLAKALKGRVKSHEKFKTAIVILKDLKIDIASSRVEFYTRPAALPQVWGSSIKQDLYRRDFTINAMAVRLNTKKFGELVDFFGGERDIKKGVIRVLHNLSFIDDPTRIFRAIRFEQRYYFKMDNHTEDLLKNALSQKIFNQITNERIRDEIILILSEARPLPALKRMEELKTLKLIHPEIRMVPKIVETIEEIAALIIKFSQLLIEEKSKVWAIYFMALVSQLKLLQIRQVAEKYKVSAEVYKKLDFDRVMITQIIRRLAVRGIKNSQIYRELEILSIEALIYLMARTNLRIVRQRIADYLFKLRKTKFIITGDDLKKWGYKPSPFYRNALKFLEEAQLDGLIKNKKQARDLLNKRFPKKG